LKDPKGHFWRRWEYCLYDIDRIFKGTKAPNYTARVALQEAIAAGMDEKTAYKFSHDAHSKRKEGATLENALEHARMIYLKK